MSYFRKNRTILLMGGAFVLFSASGTPAFAELGLQDLEAKSRASGSSMQDLLSEYEHLLTTENPLPNGDRELYQAYKNAGEEAPLWLISRLFPEAGRTHNGSRDGGDTPEAAVEIPFTSGTTWTDDGTTVGFTDVVPTNQTPPASCASSFYNTNSFGGPDAWYTFTLDDAYEVSASTCDTATYDTCLGIFDADLNLVAVNDDGQGCLDWTSSMPPCCLPAGTYYMVVDSYGVNEGDYTLSVTFGDAPCVSPCVAYTEDITALTDPTSIIGTTIEAPDVTDDGMGDVGYELSFSSGGILSFDACHVDTEANVGLYLYDGNPCDGGTLLVQSNSPTCNEGGAQFPGLISNYNILAGTYHLMVRSAWDAEGAFNISIYSACDEYAVIETVSPPSTLTGSTTEGIDITGGTAPDVGYELVVTEAAGYNIDACFPGTSFGLSLYLFDGNPCEGAELLINQNWTECTYFGAARIQDFWLEAGSYHLLIGDDWTDSGDYEILFEATPARPTSGGPDEMGYTWINSMDDEGPAYTWVDISADGTAATLTDDSSDGPFDLGFVFPFYTESYEQCYISSNGYISFGQGYTSLSNAPIPTPNDDTWNPNNFIAMFWDDLNPNNGGSVLYMQDSDNSRFIVQFDGISAFSGDVPMTFQARIYENGDIELAYMDLDEADVAGATVGTESIGGTMGLQVNYNSEGSWLGDELQIDIEAIEGDFQPPLINFTQIPETMETELPGDHLIEALITDASGVDSATLHFQLNGGEEQTSAMTNTEGDTFEGGITHQDAGAIVTWWVSAIDLAEGSNERISESYTFEVVSYTWPPISFQATDGLLSQTNLSWLPPVNPGLLAEWFDGNVPLDHGHAIEVLMERFNLDKQQALARWNSVVIPAGRPFIEYNVYRDAELVASTQDLFFQDNADSGAEADIIYEYHVTAVFDAGESDGSNADDGYWGTPPTWGGPDAFGYAWVNSENAAGPVYDWIDISATGTDLGIVGDDQSGSITLPFDFPFYGEFYTSALVSSNGYLTFQTDGTDYSNDPIPEPNEPNAAIFPFWDDLNTGNGGIIYFLSDPDNSRAIIQWQDVPFLGDAAAVNTFQVILMSSGIIKVQYGEMGFYEWASPSIGIEDGAGNTGLQYSYLQEGGSAVNGVAAVYTPPSSCEPVDCTGIMEEEPNQGWEDGSYNLLRCDDVMCGSLISTADDTDSDWYLYTHFGGNIELSLEVSDFDGRLTLRELENGGAIVAEANVFPRCFDEALNITELEGGAYYVVVEHAGEHDLTEAQNYSLSLTCTGDPCAGHEPIDCAGTPEVEPNEGWNADPPNDSFGAIAFEETVCGTVWAEDGARDMDWYRVDLTGTTDLVVNVEIDAFDAALFLTEFDPDGSILYEVDIAPACHPEQMSVQALPAGSYFIVVGHNDLYGVPIEQPYALSLSGSMPEEDMCDNYADAGDFNDIYTLSEAAPTLMHHDGTGCPDGILSPGLDRVLRLVLSESTDLMVTLTAEGEADEVILLVGDCANPESTCGAAMDAIGAGTDGESMEIPGLPAGDYYIVADFANFGEAAPFTLQVIDMNSGLIEGRELSFQLKPNYPNPFNPSTKILWVQPEMAEASFTVYNLLGKKVLEEKLGLHGAGQHSHVWNASELPSGVYIYTLRVGDFQDTRKAVLLK